MIPCSTKCEKQHYKRQWPHCCEVYFARVNTHTHTHMCMDHGVNKMPSPFLSASWGPNTWDKRKKHPGVIPLIRGNVITRADWVSQPHLNPGCTLRSPRDFFFNTDAQPPPSEVHLVWGIRGFKHLLGDYRSGFRMQWGTEGLLVQGAVCELGAELSSSPVSMVNPHHHSQDHCINMF